MVKKTKKGVSKKKAVTKKVSPIIKSRKKGRRGGGRSNQLIANSALKDVFKRQGSHRVRGGALDTIPASAEKYIYDIVSVALRSMIMDRRQTCQVKDVDVALTTRGEACY